MIQWLAEFPSPSRGVWYLGPIPIRAYALCIIAGIICALLLGDYRWKARGGQPGVVYDIALWAVPCGLIGGRLYHLLTDWPTYFGAHGAGLAAAVSIWNGGLGIWGAIGVGTLGAWIGCRHHHIPLGPFADALAPGIVLAQGIGRLGNYFNQELYGRPTSLPWGLEIFWRKDPSGLIDPHALLGVSTGQVYQIVQPTFAYELLWDLFICGLLLAIDAHYHLSHGRLFGLYVSGYCCGRFVIELLRDDPATHIGPIRINSITSACLFILASWYVYRAPRGKDDLTKIRQSWNSPQPNQPTP